MARRAHKFIAMAVICTLLLLCAAVQMPVLSASANVAQKEWMGKTDAGLLVIDEECPIEVEHENITFTVGGFSSVDDGKQDTDGEGHEKTYDCVTAEYFFYNPADYEVTAQLAFPFGIYPWYLGDLWHDDKEKCTVTIDDERVERTVRHTLCENSSFFTDTQVHRLRDDYNEDVFFTRDLQITEYRYVFENIDKKKKNTPYAALTLPFSNKTRYMLAKSNGYAVSRDACAVGLFVEERDEVVLYALGEPLAVAPEWTVYADADMKEKIGGKGILSPKTVTYTFEEFAMLYYPQESEVSRMDWYNAVVDKLLNSGRMTTGYLGAPAMMDVNRDLMRWYEYCMTIPKGGRVVNTVTAPLNPAVDTGYEPAEYDYRYLLSPAKSWAKFGTLDIKINTPNYMTYSFRYDFEKTESGYEMHLDGLPDDDLRFSLCSVPNPLRKEQGSPFNTQFIYDFFQTVGHVCVGLCIGIPVVGLTVYLCYRVYVKRNKSHRSLPDD